MNFNLIYNKSKLQSSSHPRNIKQIYEHKIEKVEMAEIKPNLGRPKTVEQVLLENGEEEEEVPRRYLWRESSDLAVPFAAEIPVIDIQRLLSSSNSAMDEELLNLHSALTSWGCFQAINHGIENSLLDEVRRLAKEFFHLPMAEKQKYACRGDDYEGYGNDLLLSENQSIDWNDRLALQVAPQDQQKFGYWPRTPESFREVLHDYTDKLIHIKDQLLKSIAKSLSIPEDKFMSHFDEGQTMYARFNYYPPCSKPDQVLGLKPHADGSAITILLQDEQVLGLQVLKDNQWFWVPIMHHALLVNLGDQIEILSNGIYKSPVHKAVTNSKRERNSLAMFCALDPAKEIEPMEEVVDDQRPRMFKKVRNYSETYFHYYQQGIRPIDAVRI